MPFPLTRDSITSSNAAPHAAFRPHEVVLPEGYYHTHFLEVVRTVGARYSDVLTPDEHAFLSGYLTLEECAQRLFVRLANRVGPWFPIAKLRYPEIGDCSHAARTLHEKGFALGPEACEATEAFALLTLADIKRVFPELRRSGATRREEFEDLCFSTLSEEDIKTRALRMVGQVVCPAHTESVRLLQFLYFGNTRQSMTDFVLSDMGVMRYESYPLDASTRAFDCRASLEDTLHARELFEEVYVALEQEREQWSKDDLVGVRDEILSALNRSHPRSHRHFWKVLTLLGNRLERAAAPVEALVCYEHSARPPARERRIRLLDRAGESAAARELALETLQQSLDETELAFAFRYLVKTARVPPADLPLPESERVGLESFLHTKNSVALWPQRAISLEATLRSMRVEEAVLFGVASEGFTGIHSENTLWRTLFGLVFWEQIFAPVQGVFHHPYQAGPTDAKAASFYAARKEGLETILKWLAACGPGQGDSPACDDVIDTLKARWETKKGTANPWVHWTSIPWEVLEIFLRHAPRQGVVKVLERMVRHPGRFDSGFPDLFLYRERADGGYDVAFWEVKGPGDQLRPDQKSWLAYLHRVGFEVSVCCVEFAS